MARQALLRGQEDGRAGGSGGSLQAGRGGQEGAYVGGAGGVAGGCSQ